MISRQELRRYFIKAEQARGDALPTSLPTHHWRLQPALAALHQALDTLADPTADSVRALVEAAFADTGWIDGWIAAMAQDALRDAYFEPPLAPTGNGFQHGVAIFAHRHVNIALNSLPVDALAAKKMQRRGPAAITFTGTVSVQKFLRAGGAVLRMWDAPQVSGNFSLDDSPKCRPAGYRALEDGEILTLDGRTQSYVIEHAIGDIVVLQAEILLDRAPLLVEYDSEDLTAVAACSTSDTASRSQMLLSFLASLGRSEDDAVVEPFTHDDSFFLRWHATTELFRLNEGRARARLRTMAERDPHPDLRAAARNALGMIEAEAGACHA
ncbi:hypothetical protein Q9Q95_13220 [Sphingomonas sp. DG1-23]|uniref:hypothetical protein n=1 Tax=Sphingomonas sp. DG1-23 TaxID=3068316 RepID=UPI00273D52FC|nr:hypothetical protein [Sphingomonas sp. DG1-23]MDP5279889.1 hypothetical protein [Sphingomonas sp. DG1-23]